MGGANPNPIALDPNNPTSYRADGSMKSLGYKGLLPDLTPNPRFAVTGEQSFGTEDVTGKEMDIPKIIPTTTLNEQTYLQTIPIDQQDRQNPKLMNEIRAKAVDFAKHRIAEGKSVWAQPNEIPAPNPGFRATPNFYGRDVITTGRKENEIERGIRNAEQK